MAETMTADDMVRAYIRLRDHKEAAERELKKSLERVVQGMEKLENLMLDYLNTSGAKNITTDAGTVYVKTRESASVKDREAFLRYIFTTKNLELLDARANKSVVRKIMDETGEVPPGVNVSTMKTVGVRRGD